MGAATFETHATGPTADAAFRSAVDRARYEDGHGGYTGTIAEKDGYVLFPLPAGIPDVGRFIDLCLDAYDDADRPDDVPDTVWAAARRICLRIDDKWGPAGAFDLGDGRYVFFGWASC